MGVLNLRISRCLRDFVSWPQVGKLNGKSFLVDKAVLNVFRMMGMMGGEYVAVTNSGALPLEQVLREQCAGGCGCGCCRYAIGA